jgi:hypothetical protein
VAFAITRTPPRALTSSARRLSYQESSYSKRMTMPWQLRALVHYDLIGEVRFASQFYAKKLSRVKFFPAYLEPDGSKTPIEDGPPVELLNRIQDPAGGRSRLQYDYGRLKFVTGEGVLFGSRLGEPEEQWKFLWKDEVKIDENGIAIRLREDRQPVEPVEFGVAYRMWTPHPRHSDLPDSPLHAVADIAEELIVLTASVMSTATTRLTNGLLALATELSPGAAEPVGDEDPENNIFIRDFTDHLQRQIENPGDAAAKVPFVVEGGFEYIMEGIKWQQLHDPQTDYMEKELRTEAVRRLAIGLDFNPEYLMGMTDANHWTAKQVVWDQWQSFGAPIAEDFGDDLNQAYLRPALRNEGFARAEDVVIAYDDSEVVISPDRSEDALKAHKDGLIGGKPARIALGWTEKDKMDDDEREEWLAVQLRQPALLGGEAAEMFGPGARGPLAQGNGSSAENGPRTPGSGRLVSRQESRTASVLVEGAAMLALHRCRELAGIRIRHAHENAKLADPCPDCTNGLLASVVGAERIPDPMKLVRGGADNFVSLLVEMGFEATQAKSLGQDLELYSGRTLFHPEQPDLPSGFIASIEKAREVSDALNT